MWLKVESRRAYLSRIYVNGVNAVAGLAHQRSSGQDYIVTPDQYMLNGHKDTHLTVVQFLCPEFTNASPDMANHYGIQLEITPHESKDYFTASLMSIEDPFKSATPLDLYLGPDTAIGEVKSMMTRRLGFTKNSFHLHCLAQRSGNVETP
jgi:hypothetical protein